MLEVLPKHQKIAEFIRSRIVSGKLEPGERLPSYRSLMAQFNATVGVVRQAINTLQTEGLIETVPRVGCRVAEQPGEWKTIGVAIFGYANSVFRVSQFKQIHDELEQLQCDVAIRFVEEVTASSLDACCDWARRLDGVLLTGRVSLRVAQRLLETGKPLVQVGDLTDAPLPSGLSAVTVDVPSMVRLAVSYLFANGHRRIALDTDHGSRYFETLTTAFRAIMKEYGLDEQWIDLTGDAERPVSRDVPALLGELDSPPTAILSEGGVRATKVIDAFHSAGWPVPERLSVVAISESTHFPEIRDDLSCVLSSTREMDLRAARILNRQLRNPSAGITLEKVVASLVPGRTCRPIEPPPPPPP